MNRNGILRTPEARFASLPGYPFAPNYADVEAGLRMHFADEGAKDGPTVLLLHGEPSWSYLYRKMIPILANAGLRAVAPDLIGFGKSDKLPSQADYSYALHVQWIARLVELLGLRDITLFCQDWGSLIGLRVAAEHADRFARIAVGNGFLPAGQRPAAPAFRLWRAFASYSPVFPIGRIVAAGCRTKLSRQVRAAYDAPFPSREYTAGARVFPRLVPFDENDPAMPANRRAWDLLGKWEKPFLTLFGENDPLLGKGDRALQRHVPGAKGQPHERLQGGHFIQEDQGEHLAHALVRWLSPGKAAPIAG